LSNTDRKEGAVDKPITSPQSDLYSEGWDRIFGSKDKLEVDNGKQGCTQHEDGRGVYR